MFQATVLVLWKKEKENLYQNYFDQISFYLKTNVFSSFVMNFLDLSFLNKTFLQSD